MRCARCGRVVGAGDMTCSHCGAALASSTYGSGPPERDPADVAARPAPRFPNPPNGLAPGPGDPPPPLDAGAPGTAASRPADPLPGALPPPAWGTERPTWTPPGSGEPGPWTGTGGATYRPTGAPTATAPPYGQAPVYGSAPGYGPAPGYGGAPGPQTSWQGPNPYVTPGGGPPGLGPPSGFTYRPPVQKRSNKTTALVVGLAVIIVLCLLGFSIAKDSNKHSVYQGLNGPGNFDFSFGTVLVGNGSVYSLSMQNVVATSIADGSTRFTAPHDCIGGTWADTTASTADAVAVLRCGGGLTGIDTRTGAQRWTINLKGTPTEVRVTPTLVAVVDSTVRPATVTAYDAALGDLRFEHRLEASTPPNAVAANGDRVFITDGDELVTIDGTNGKELWRSRSDAVSITASDDGLFVLSTDHRVVRLDPLSGETTWRGEVDETLLSNATIAGTTGGSVIVTTGGSDVLAYDTKTGTLRWSSSTGRTTTGGSGQTTPRRRAPSRPTIPDEDDMFGSRPVAIGDGRVILNDVQGFEILDAADGTQLDSAPYNYTAGPISIGDGSYAYIDYEVGDVAIEKLP